MLVIYIWLSLITLYVLYKEVISRVNFYWETTRYEGRIIGILIEYGHGFSLKHKSFYFYSSKELKRIEDQENDRETQRVKKSLAEFEKKKAEDMAKLKSYNEKYRR